MMRYYIGLGTNLGDREKNLRTAVRLLEERVGKVTSLSAFYATEPWGFTSDNAFLNAAAELHTSLLPLEVLERTQEIERVMGRSHKSVAGVYADRVIDIDLLLCQDDSGRSVRVDTPQLTLPHPLMHLRDFVLKPLAEIAPEVVQLIRQG
ncbi:MAG TPA: 2-amino-4-hydroxy-6-hydroxymethyldihydropteridine diphosphokinase [Candidatus Bacteroides merdigallinarum]|uniref:2-amino-4-hydroxy-6-hydroxymethyldihydropteridine pyrophosphokinase n=1 Tax=Candidatus Bacteroides merdigallinarum TaxID=2838473 RepID=A0A9D2E8M4_9BACE|nr:2-amino-4-hydroxy-6-hydroxymethyldihydropteridine diphosphokinase [Candidatus Bacteroides merdigallinarum]